MINRRIRKQYSCEDPAPDLSKIDLELPLTLKELFGGTFYESFTNKALCQRPNWDNSFIRDYISCKLIIVTLKKLYQFWGPL